MKIKKKILKIAIDSPAAAGAGTIAKKISSHYNLFYLDTGKIYRLIAFLKINYPKNFNLKFIKTKINKLKVSDLNNKKLISDKVGTEASIISKKKIFVSSYMLFKLIVLITHQQILMGLVLMEEILLIRLFLTLTLNSSLLLI